MQNPVWQINKSKTPCSNTFFTSQFYDFNNSNSQMEDFDLSKEYLRSQLSQKSTILRHMAQEHFMKAIQVYYKFSLFDSFGFWKKYNEKEKKKQKLNPRNMTKVFLRVFYLLNKKMRSSLEKSFNKTVNFTKQNDMKTYQTPHVKGVKKLQDSLQTLNSKYFYNHPIISQHLIKYCFYQIKTFCKANKNEKKLINMMILLQKMSNHVALQQFNEKMCCFQKLNDKLEIFIGTLSLMINPINRYFFHKFKDYRLNLNCILDELDQSIRVFQPSIQKQQITRIQQQQLSFIKKQSKQSQQNIVCQHRINNKSQKNPINQILTDYFTEPPGNQIKKQSQVQNKNSLTFSKQLRRKSPSFDKKNKLKFKSIPAGTPKKQSLQQNYISKNLQIGLKKDKQTEFITKQKQVIAQINVNKSKINLNSIFKNSKALQENMKFQKSLNFAIKSNRKITINQKVHHTNLCRPHQFCSSYPDYFDFYAFSQIPNFKLKNNQTTVKDQNKKGFKIFKTIKSGKSFTNLDDVPNTTPTNHSFKNNQSKLTLKLMQNQIAEILSTDSLLYQQNSISLRRKIESTKFNRQNMKSASNIQQIASEKLINFKSLQKAASNSSLYELKNQYRFPITNQINKNLGLLLKYSSPHIPREFHSEYQNNFCQPLIQANKDQIKVSEISRDNSLTFKTHRPMKKVKSGDKQITIKGISSKKQRKVNDKILSKQKRNKEIKSQFIDAKQQISNLYYKVDNTAMLSVRSSKSISKQSLTKNLGLKLNNKK